MLLLYTKLVRNFLTPLEWDIKPNQPNFKPSDTEQNSQDFDYISQRQINDKIYQNQEIYYLERRFLLPHFQSNIPRPNQ